MSLTIPSGRRIVMNKEEKSVENTGNVAKKSAPIPKDVTVLGPGYEWWFENTEDDVYDEKYRD
jgi:hypothetical protein